MRDPYKLNEILANLKEYGAIQLRPQMGKF